MAKEKHEVRVILRDWTKALKANSHPVAEIHTKTNKEKGD